MSGLCVTHTGAILERFFEISVVSHVLLCLCGFKCFDLRRHHAAERGEVATVAVEQWLPACAHAVLVGQD